MNRHTSVLRRAWDRTRLAEMVNFVLSPGGEKRPRGSTKGPRYFFVPIRGGHRAVLNPARLNKYGSDRSYKR